MRKSQTKTQKLSNKTSKHDGLTKLLRIVIYLFTIIGTVSGASLIKIGGLSAAYADGTYVAKIQNGEILFFVFLIILCANVMWGILRWFLRGYREQWKAGRIIGKLIGGGIWRTLAIMPLILLSLFFIAPKISEVIDQNALAKDARTGIVATLSWPTERLEYIANHLEDFTIEELREELEPYLFNNVQFGTDASGNTATTQTSGLFTQNAFAYNRNVTTLNKVALSPSEKFIVFYTDTGDNAILDSEANELASMADDIVKKYSNLGFKYENNTVKVNDEVSLLAAKMLLKANGIDENILSTAMPIYVMDPFKDGSRTLAFYTGRKNADLLGHILIGLASLGIAGKDTAEMAWMINSTPLYPFFTILPEYINSDSLPVISAHELGHHYESIYGYSQGYNINTPGNFINETIANWMAINVYPDRKENDAINADHYNETYLLEDMGKTIRNAGDASGLVGYAAVAFLENYANIVPNASTIIMEADFSTDPLEYLYNSAGAELFQKTMTSLAEKNLTGDYGGKLINYILPHGEQNPCTDFCTETYEIAPAATEYLYFATTEYLNTTIEFLGNMGETSVSILGKNSSSSWEILESGAVKAEFKITEEVADKYEIIAFAVADYTIQDADEYIIKITKTEMEDIIADEGEYDFSSFYSELGDGCIEIDTNALFDDLTQIVDMGAELIGALSELGTAFDETADFSGVKAEYDESAMEAKTALSEAKSDLAPYRIVICGNYVKEGLSFDAVKYKLQSAMGWNIEILDEKDGSDRINVFAGGDLLTRVGRIYILARSSNETGLITINISER